MKNPLYEKNIKRTVTLCSILIFAMLTLAFVSVPLYRLFCEVTGYGGQPVISQGEASEQGDMQPLARQITIRFDSNVDRNLPWDFAPEKSSLSLPIGQKTTFFYRAKNRSDLETTGMAVFNVTPEAAAAYFVKIECFCFSEQTLKPGQEVRMPVVFFIDPEIQNEALLKNLDAITLSYTFYPL